MPVEERLHHRDAREYRRAAERRLRQLRLLCVAKRRVDIAFFHFARITLCPAFFPNPADLIVVAAQIKGRVDNPEENSREYRDADHPHARLPPKIRRRRLKPSEAPPPPLLNIALDRTIRKLLVRLRRGRRSGFGSCRSSAASLSRQNLIFDYRKTFHAKVMI
jgi:hypothetical protein